jgi:hypothetical protein
MNLPNSLIISSLASEENVRRKLEILQKSVLSGEYYKIGFKEELLKFDNNAFLKKVDDSLINDDSSEQRISLKQPGINIIYYKKALLHYRYIIDVVENITRNLNKDNTDEFSAKRNPALKFEIEKIVSENFDSQEFPESMDYLYFLISLYLVEIDEYLESSFECLNRIIEIKRILDLFESRVDKENLNEHRVLTHKCNFLIYKIKARRERKRIDNSIVKDSIFQEFIAQTSNHYDINLTEQQREEFKKLNQNTFEQIFDTKRPDEKFSVQKIHSLNKFIKKNETLSFDSKIEHLKSLKEKLDVLLIKEDVETICNGISLMSLKHLIDNTIVRLILQKDESEGFKQLINENIMCEGLVISKSLNIEFSNTHHDYRKYECLMEYFENFLNYFFSNSEKIIKQFLILSETDNYSSLKIKVNELREKTIILINNIRRNYELIFEKLTHFHQSASTYDFKPVYLSYQDCLLEYEWGTESIKLYLDSSYILPIDYAKKKEKFYSKLDIFNSKIHTLKLRLDDEIQQITNRKLNDEYLNKVKENEFKVVQIVAMFVTIATFVFSSVKVFENRSGMQAFAIILGMGSFFLLFNVYFKWLISYQIGLKTNREFIESNNLNTSGILEPAYTPTFKSVRIRLWQAILEEPLVLFAIIIMIASFTILCIDNESYSIKPIYNKIEEDSIENNKFKLKILEQETIHDKQIELIKSELDTISKRTIKLSMAKKTIYKK